MASQRVENLARAFAAFNEGDMEAVAEFVDPSFHIDDRVVPEANPTEQGPDALVENANQVREAFGELSWEPREVLEVGDYILVRVHATGKGLHTALPLNEDLGHVYTLEGELAIKLDIYRTWGEAKTAVGIEVEQQ